MPSLLHAMARAPPLTTPADPLALPNTNEPQCVAAADASLTTRQAQVDESEVTQNQKRE
jgi:hypothetical protein